MFWKYIKILHSLLLKSKKKKLNFSLSNPLSFYTVLTLKTLKVIFLYFKCYQIINTCYIIFFFTKYTFFNLFC